MDSQPSEPEADGPQPLKPPPGAARPAGVAGSDYWRSNHFSSVVVIDLVAARRVREMVSTLIRSPGQGHGSLRVSNGSPLDSCRVAV